MDQTNLMNELNLMASERTVRTLEAARHGKLEVYTTYDAGGAVKRKLFTFASLAEVLNMPPTTLEGRYQRGKLKYLKRDIPNSAGRAARGFDYSTLEQVITIIKTPGAFVSATAEAPALCERQPLVPVLHEGVPHFTVQALADFFGKSATTIRNKLTTSGLIRRMVNLGASKQGGRPQRAFPESMLGAVKLAIEEGISFASPLDQVLADSDGRTPAATRDMVRETNPFRQSATNEPVGGYDALNLQLNAMMAGAVIPKENPAALLQQHIKQKAEPTMTPSTFRAYMEWCHQRALEGTKELPDTDKLCEDLADISNRLEGNITHPEYTEEMKAEATELLLTRERARQIATQWYDEWMDLRQERIPAIEACRDMLRSRLIEERTDAPSVAEIEAAMTVFAQRRPLLETEYMVLRTEIAKFHRMAGVVRKVNRDELRIMNEYLLHELNYKRLWAVEEDKLHAQRAQAGKAKDDIINTYMSAPGEEVYEQAIAALIAEGVHPAYAKREIGSAKWYHETVKALSSGSAA